MRERDIARALADREDGECEVSTPAGFIDVLTAKAVYEVKEVSKWKAALGQVLAYARYYPNHTPKLYLYGKATGKQKTLIQEHCALFQVRVVWHTEATEATPALREPRPTKTPTNAMTLRISAHDHSYGVASACTARIITPTASIPRADLEAYLDTVVTVFDNLLDNALTITVKYCFEGEQVTLQRTRASIAGNPVCYRLNLSIWAGARAFSTSLPGLKNSFPSGQRIRKGYDYAHSQSIPEVNQLFALILHPTFGWTDQYGNRATSISKAYWISYGMKKTRHGYKMGG